MKSIRMKIVVAFLAIILISVLTIAKLIYQEDKTEFEAMLGQRLEAMAASGALQIDGDDHENIFISDDGESVGNYKGRDVVVEGADEFNLIRKGLIDLMHANNLKTDIYTLRSSESQGQMEFVVMTNANPYTGNLYSQNVGIIASLESGKPGHSKLYEDEHGFWISAYAPIKDADGGVVGILEIDYEASELHNKLQARLYTLSAIGLLSLMFAFAISLLLSKKITDPIVHLSLKMADISRGDLTARADIRTNDELENAAKVFNEMAEGLQAKQELLAYVSKAAWEAAHKRANQEEKELSGESKVVTMLFSDIKGFTPMSTTKPAAEVVELLNEYFGKMTTVIMKHNGSIDKFIGDAIMAVFEGGDDNGATDTVAAAVEMQVIMAETKFDTPLAIRVGVHTGQVVMGDIGSLEFRRDYTVIGDNVNRTQRLETKCTPGKVRISKETYELVKTKFKAESCGLTELKGVSEAVETFEIHPLDYDPES